MSELLNSGGGIRFSRLYCVEHPNVMLRPIISSIGITCDAYCFICIQTFKRRVITEKFKLCNNYYLDENLILTLR